MRPATALRVLRAVLTCDVRGVLPDVTAPCSIVHCGGDSVAPLAVARYMQRAMVACAGARGADTVVIESSGHFPQLAAPKEFVQAIEAVLIDH
jgi:pimeloyl-ACP methyl ester carboxylesterase